jgi:uncharacterized protein (TIGR03066 family)
LKHCLEVVSTPRSLARSASKGDPCWRCGLVLKPHPGFDAPGVFLRRRLHYSFLRGRIMRILRLAMAASLVILLASSAFLHAEDKAKDLIVGKWQPTKPPEGFQVVIEFTKDGKFKMDGKVKLEGKKEQDIKREGTFKFLDDDTMELTVEQAGKGETTKVKIIKISKDELITRDDGKKEDNSFKRVK